MTNKKTDLSGTSTGYKVFAVVILVLITLFFLFPLYWIVTGSFKDAMTINARTPQWFPLSPTLENYAKLFKNPAGQWLLNTIIMAVGALVLTCLTAALAGYALAKKRFYGRALLFTIIIKISKKFFNSSFAVNESVAIIMDKINQIRHRANCI